jgi:hypothetical protein
MRPGGGREDAHAEGRELQIQRTGDRAVLGARDEIAP